MQADDRLGLVARLDDRIPVGPIEDRRQPDHMRPFGQGNRGEPTGRVAADLGGRHLRIGEERDAARNDAIWVWGLPLLVDPVVPGRNARLAQLGVGGVVEEAAAEARDLRREVERGPHAVDVHVADAGLDVKAARPHLVEPERLELHSVGPATRHGVHADLGEGLAVEGPHLMPGFGLDDARRHVGELRRKAALERVGWLNDMVIHRDQRVLHLARRRFGKEQLDRVTGRGHRNPLNSFPKYGAPRACSTVPGGGGALFPAR